MLFFFVFFCFSLYIYSKVTNSYIHRICFRFLFSGNIPPKKTLCKRGNIRCCVFVLSCALKTENFQFSLYSFSNKRKKQKQNIIFILCTVGIVGPDNRFVLCLLCCIIFCRIIETVQRPVCLFLFAPITVIQCALCFRMESVVPFASSAILQRDTAKEIKSIERVKNKKSKNVLNINKNILKRSNCANEIGKRKQ